MYDWQVFGERSLADEFRQEAKYGSKDAQLELLLRDNGQEPLLNSEFMISFQKKYSWYSIEEMYEALLRIRAETGYDGLKKAQVEMQRRLKIAEMPCLEASTVGWLYINAKHPEYLELDVPAFRSKALELLKTPGEVVEWVKGEGASLEIISYFVSDWLIDRLEFGTWLPWLVGEIFGHDARKQTDVEAS